jgi:hypothetical protein
MENDKFFNFNTCKNKEFESNQFYRKKILLFFFFLIILDQVFRIRKNKIIYLI